MTAASAIDVGLVCPDCHIRDLISWWRAQHFRCECCGRVYRLSLDPTEGILLTLTDERFMNRRTDALPSTEQPATRHLELVKLGGDAR